MDKKTLKQLQEKLKERWPKKYAKLLRERSGKSESAIFKTFNPNYPLIVDEVVDAAIELLKEGVAKDKIRLNDLKEIL